VYVLYFLIFQVAAGEGRVYIMLDKIIVGKGGEEGIYYMYKYSVG